MPATQLPFVGNPISSFVGDRDRLPKLIGNLSVSTHAQRSHLIRLSRPSSKLSFGVNRNTCPDLVISTLANLISPSLGA